MKKSIVQIKNTFLISIIVFFRRYSEVSARNPLQLDDMTLAKLIQHLGYETTDADKECNENVRKMISSLQFVS